MKVSKKLCFEAVLTARSRDLELSGRSPFENSSPSASASTIKKGNEPAEPVSKFLELSISQTTWSASCSSLDSRHLSSSRSLARSAVDGLKLQLPIRWSNEFAGYSRKKSLISGTRSLAFRRKLSPASNPSRTGRSRTILREDMG